MQIHCNNSVPEDILSYIELHRVRDPSFNLINGFEVTRHDLNYNRLPVIRRIIEAWKYCRLSCIHAHINEGIKGALSIIFYKEASISVIKRVNDAARSAIRPGVQPETPLSDEMIVRRLSEDPYALIEEEGRTQAGCLGICLCNNSPLNLRKKTVADLFSAIRRR